MVAVAAVLARATVAPTAAVLPTIPLLVASLAATGELCVRPDAAPGPAQGVPPVAHHCIRNGISGSPRYTIMREYETGRPLTPLLVPTIRVVSTVLL